jgi:hypothetical protein
LFDSERAIRAGIGEEPAAPAELSSTDDDAEALDGDTGGIAIVLDPEVVALLARELPDWLELSRLFPEHLPREWSELEAEPPAG